MVLYFTSCLQKKQFYPNKRDNDITVELGRAQV